MDLPRIAVSVAYRPILEVLKRAPFFAHTNPRPAVRVVFHVVSVVAPCFHVGPDFAKSSTGFVSIKFIRFWTISREVDTLSSPHTLMRAKLSPMSPDGLPRGDELATTTPTPNLC
jgi:hypothetical protein